MRAAIESAPGNLRITPREIGELPLYNADLEKEVVPSVVAELREAVRRSEGLLVATPEYNHGVPGVLKNAIDWLSRPVSDSALDGKVAAVIGASPGLTGTVRSQVQLRQVFASTCCDDPDRRMFICNLLQPARRTSALNHVGQATCAS